MEPQGAQKDLLQVRNNKTDTIKKKQPPLPPPRRDYGLFFYHPNLFPGEVDLQRDNLSLLYTKDQGYNHRLHFELSYFSRFHQISDLANLYINKFNTK